MKTSARRSKSARKARSASKAALGRYLAAGLGATGLATAECDAAVINLNISALGTPPSNRSGVNGGVANGESTNIQYVVPFAVTGQINQMGILNNSGDGYFGLNGAQYMEFLAGSTVASPTNLPFGALAGPTTPDGSSWGNINNINSYFRYAAYTSPNFGPGSFMGFRVENTEGDYNYGYFEVTWNNSNNQFQILSGAYESTPNTPIAVPEPSTIALAGIGALALGAGAIRRSRKARKAAAEGSLAEAV
jgi:hypothetical protein